MCKGIPLVPTLARLTGRDPGQIRVLTRILEKDRSQPTGAEKAGIRATGTLAPPAGRGRLKAVHRRFLRQRGFDPKLIAEEWGVEGINERGGRYAWKLYVPILLGVNVVSWTTRAVSDGDPRRYDAAPDDREAYPAKRLLYGEHKCGHSVVVVEGPLDVWAVGPGAVCTLGTAYSRAQLLRLAKFPRRVVCFDAEPAAQAVARRLVRDLEVFEGETVNVVLETGKDPSRCSRKELTRLRRMVA
jgi:hypothetical protein